MNTSRRILHVSAVLLMLAVVGRAKTEVSTPTAAARLARALVALSEFTEWPPGFLSPKHGVLMVGLLGPQSDTQIQLSDQILRQRDGQQTVVISFQPESEVPRCQVVFIPDSERDRVEEHLQSLQGLPVLTVSTIDGFVELGGMVEVHPQKGRIRIEINLDAIDQQGLSVSSRLIELARLHHEVP